MWKMTLHENIVPTTVVQKRSGEGVETGERKLASKLWLERFRIYGFQQYFMSLRNILSREKKKSNWNELLLNSSKHNKANDFCIRSQHKLFKILLNPTEVTFLNKRFLSKSDHTPWKFMFQLKTQYYLIITTENN